MPIRNGQAYIKSLQDGRQIWLRGQKIEVATYPDTAPFVRVVSNFYDWQHDPRLQNLLTITSPSSGDRVSAAYLIPESGEDILMVPGHAEMNNPEISGDLHRYLVGKDARAPERFRMLKLAWDYTCDSFGSRQYLFEMHNAATLAINKSHLVQNYDTGPFVRLAKYLARIDREMDPGPLEF